MRKKKKALLVEMPEVGQLEAELQRDRHRVRYRYTLRTTLYTLMAAVALAVLVAMLWMPVLQIYGSSMTPTLNAGEVVVCLKGGHLRQGDVIAFYYNNKVLIKRVIASAGDWVDISEDGTVYVNEEAIDEPYLTEQALGECDIELPYQVPSGRYFVLGDHRATSMDSRSTTVGCVAEEEIVGRVVFRVWPLQSIGRLS